MVQEEYLNLLDLAYEVVQSLKGKKPENLYLTDSEQLAGKIFYHAAAVYQLRQGTTVPVPYSESGSSFYDFPSVAVLARATLETFLTMFEVFFEPVTEDEFEYNHALWQLSGFIIRENFPDAAPTVERQIKQQSEIQGMRDRIQNTTKFRSMKRGEQNEILRGIRKRKKEDWERIAKAAGFGKQTLRQIYIYQSGFVHADGLSGTQMVSVETAQEQIEFIEIHMRTIMIVLSKMIIQFAKKFPESRRACEKRPDVFRRANVWSESVNILP